MKKILFLTLLLTVFNSSFGWFHAAPQTRWSHKKYHKSNDEDFYVNTPYGYFVSESLGEMILYNPRGKRIRKITDNTIMGDCNKDYVVVVKENYNIDVYTIEGVFVRTITTNAHWIRISGEQVIVTFRNDTITFEDDKKEVFNIEEC